MTTIVPKAAGQSTPFQDVNDLEKLESNGSNLMGGLLLGAGASSPTDLAQMLKGLPYDASGKASLPMKDGGKVPVTQKPNDGGYAIQTQGSTINLSQDGTSASINFPQGTYSLTAENPGTNDWQRVAVLNNGAKNSMVVKDNGDGTYTALATQRSAVRDGQPSVAASSKAVAATPLDADRLANRAVDYSVTLGRASTINDVLPDNQVPQQGSLLQSLVSITDGKGTAQTAGEVDVATDKGVIQTPLDPITTQGPDATRDGLLRQNQNSITAAAGLAADIGKGSKSNIP